MTAIAAPLGEPDLLTRSRWPVSDTLTITQRNLLIWMRNPAYIAFTIVQPVIFVLLFAYVFGGAIHIPGVSYIDFLLPGILVQTATFAGLNTGLALAEDLKNGLMDRFWSLPMSRFAVVTGRIAADTVLSSVAVLVMIGVGFLIGFRFHGGLTYALAAVAFPSIAAPGFGALLIVEAAFTILVWGEKKNEDVSGSGDRSRTVR